MLGFCEICRNETEYTIKEEKMIKNIRGKEYQYIGKRAFCNECKSEIFISDVRDYNLEMLDMVFRENEGLISVEEINAILEKYKIGKRPLSLLLGWGEGTITRYLGGDIPNKPYSDQLKLILNNPDNMKELLEENKSKISGIAYRRCNSTLLEIENKEETVVESMEKIDHIVKYLLVSCSDITPLALQKLLYYSQGFFVAFTGEYLFQNNCEAWVHGPVYPNVYHKYKNHGFNPIEEDRKRFTDFELTRVEMEVLDNIIRNFGCYSGKILEKMTHVETPWRQTRMGLADDANSNRVIEKELIEEYFRNITKKYNMLNISDIKDYSTELFNKLYV